MSIVRINTNFNIDIDFEAPPFHQRLFAWVIDLFLLIFYIVIASKFINWLELRVGYSKDSLYNLWAVGLLLILPFFLYHLVCEITMNGQSIGKKLMGIRVVSENGGKPSISQYIIRWLIRTSDYTVLIIIIYAPYIAVYGPMFFWALGGSVLLLFADIVLVNSRKQQRLGDMLAHTLLIRTKQNVTIDDTVFQAVASDYVPSFPQVMQLSDRDINTLKTILTTAQKSNDLLLAANTSEKIKSHLHIETSMPPFEFLNVLLKDYNYLSGT
jgi:uncharacterized RDD family membrane protein YckC